jgi:hypothetical protein
VSAQLDPEHKRFLDNRFAVWQKEQPKSSELRQILLNIGGQALVAPPNNYEADLEPLISLGRVINGQLEVVCMDDNACHLNVANLWEKAGRADFGIGTGYGLNAGLWRQHTWAMDSDKLIETTVKREAYFGVVYFGKDAEAFCDRLAP